MLSFRQKRNAVVAFLLTIAMSANVYAPVFADDVTRVIEDHVLYQKLRNSWPMSSYCTFDDASYSITVTDSCRENVTSFYLYSYSDDDGKVQDISVIAELFPNIRDFSLYGQDLDIDISFLNDLTKLESIRIEGVNIDSTPDLSNLIELKYLDINETGGLSDISSLSALHSLTNLDLGYNDISNIGTLADLTNLTELRLSHNMITDISALEGLTSLRYLYLYGNNITDVSALDGLTELRGLDLDDNNISDVTPLADLTALTQLDLSYNDISSISSLSTLTNLYTLSLSNNKLTSLDGIPASVSRLDADNNNISDISALTNLSGHIIDEISLNNNSISNVSALGSLDVQNGLRLKYNNINDVSALAGLTNLYNLELNHNNINDISSLNSLTRLSSLELSYNNITTIPKLDQLTNLDELNLNYNNISDISNIGSMADMRELCLGGNNISDITALGDLEDLRYLRLSENNISDISALARNTHINDLYIDRNPDIVDYSALSELKNMDELDISYNNLDDTRINEIAGFIADSVRQGDDARTIDYLAIDGNPDITDWSFLALFADLDDLSLKDNGIEHIPDLTANAELYRLDLSDNKISDISDIMEKLPVDELEELLLRNNDITDASPVSGMSRLDYATFAGNHINEMVELDFGDHDVDSSLMKVIPFMNQKIDLVFSGKDGDLPKIAKQVDDFIVAAIGDGGGDIPVGMNDLLSNALHLDNVDVNGDLSKATIIDTSKPASVSYYVGYDDLVNVMMDGGKGGGVDDDYGEWGDDDASWEIQRYFGYNKGDENVYFLRINIVSDEMANPKTLDSVMIAIISFAVIAVAAGFSTRRYVHTARR